MRVLLVEDNPINQQVAQELLQAQGARVSLANNGALGLAAIREAQPAFHVVLMDLQMPVMDGLSATRLLRTDASFADLPVIAMTANAMHSDREECLAAGMNDHVGKPFDLNQLVQTLINHTGWVARSSAQPAAGAAASAATLIAEHSVPAASSAPDTRPWPDGLEVEQALARMGGDRHLLQRAVLAYVADARLLPQRLEQGLQQALQPGALEQVQRDLHGFKGLSATIGANALSRLAAQAEGLVLAPLGLEACRQAVAQFSQQLAAQLPLLEAVARRLQEEDADHAAGPQAGTGAAVDLAQLKALLAALLNADMVAMELHARLRQELGGDWDAALAPLDRAMAELEFKAAALECEKLVRQFDTSEGQLLT
jgi:CheY-like chemotaxis protein